MKTFEEIKKECLEQIKEVREECEVLKNNLDEFERLVNLCNSEEDARKYEDFDVEKGLKHISVW